jgi:hypothetical protein
VRFLTTHARKRLKESQEYHGVGEIRDVHRRFHIADQSVLSPMLGGRRNFAGRKLAAKGETRIIALTLNTAMTPTR